MTLPPKRAAEEMQGLSTPEAQVRLRQFGKNEIVPSSWSSGPVQVLRFIKDPMGLMLLAHGGSNGGRKRFKIYRAACFRGPYS